MVHPLSGFQPCVCLYASILKVSEVEKRKQRLQRQESKLQQRVQRVVQSDASERCVHAGGMHACMHAWLCYVSSCTLVPRSGTATLAACRTCSRLAVPLRT